MHHTLFVASGDLHNNCIEPSSCQTEKPKSLKYEEKIRILEEQIQRLTKQICCNANFAQDLHQAKVKLQWVEDKLKGKKDVTVTSGCQAQLYVNPLRPTEEDQQLKHQLHQIESETRRILSLNDLLQKQQVNQYEELQNLKLENFVKNRILSYNVAYDFTEKLLTDACDSDGKSLHILADYDGRFQLNGKQHCIGVLRKRLNKKLLWKGRFGIKLEDKHRGVESASDWFDKTGLGNVYEWNKKCTILAMFNEEINKLELTDMVQPSHSLSDEGICDEILIIMLGLILVNNLFKPFYISMALIDN